MILSILLDLLVSIHDLCADYKDLLHMGCWNSFCTGKPPSHGIFSLICHKSKLGWLFNRISPIASRFSDLCSYIMKFINKFPNLKGICDAFGIFSHIIFWQSPFCQSWKSMDCQYLYANCSQRRISLCIF